MIDVRSMFWKWEILRLPVFFLPFQKKDKNRVACPKIESIPLQTKRKTNCANAARMSQINYLLDSVAILFANIISA